MVEIYGPQGKLRAVPVPEFRERGWIQEFHDSPIAKRLKLQAKGVDGQVPSPREVAEEIERELQSQVQTA